MRCSLVYSKSSELHFPCLKPCWVPPLPQLCSAWSANRSTNGRKEQRRRTIGFHWYQPSNGSYSTTNVKCKTFAFYKKILHLDFYHFSMIDFTSALMLFRIVFFLGQCDSVVMFKCFALLRWSFPGKQYHFTHEEGFKLMFPAVNSFRFPLVSILVPFSFYFLRKFNCRKFSQWTPISTLCKQMPPGHPTASR